MHQRDGIGSDAGVGSHTLNLWHIVNQAEIIQRLERMAAVYLVLIILKDSATRILIRRNVAFWLAVGCCAAVSRADLIRAAVSPFCSSLAPVSIRAAIPAAIAIPAWSSRSGRRHLSGRGGIWLRRSIVIVAAASRSHQRKARKHRHQHNPRPMTSLVMSPDFHVDLQVVFQAFRNYSTRV